MDGHQDNKAGRGRKSPNLRGRGRGQCRGSSSRGRGNNSNKPISAYDEALSATKKNIKRTKDAWAKMSPSVRKEYMERKQEKQIERVLLPDAPPRRRTRKLSPERTECRLVMGTPATPPPPKLTSWQLAKQQTSTSIKTSSSPAPSPSPSPGLERLSRTSSLASFDSYVEVPGFAPLRVDWRTGQLVTAQPSTSTAQPSTSTAQPSTSRAQPSTSTAYSSTSKTEAKYEKESSQHVAVHSSPTTTSSSTYKGKKVISAKDIYSSEASALINDWCRHLEDDSDDDVEEFATVNDKGTTFTPLESSNLPDFLTKNATDWLITDDIDSNTILRDLLPTDNLNFNWMSDSTTFRGQRETFKGKPGPTFEMDVTVRPVDVFLKFFDDDLLDLLVYETNKYSTYIIDRDLTEHSRLNYWKNTDRGEMAIFLAILIFQGLGALSEEKDYWRENGYLTLKYFKNLMTYNRFILLKRLLHFTPMTQITDNMTIDEIKLRKIQPVLEHLQGKFKTLYLPGRDIVIDESLLKWHGKLSFAQKIATKAAKVGIKSYELCESSTGYTWNFFVYAGKGETKQPVQTDEGSQDSTLIDLTADMPHDLTTDDSSKPPPPTNATAQIVYTLAKPLLGKGHTLIMDNFYNSPLLARYLKCNGTDCFGTLRLNREFVPEAIKGVSKSQLRPGEIIQSYCDDLYVMVWRDTNVVAMISTFHDGKVGGKEKYGIYKYKPEIVRDYNISMGGVDKKDQLLSAHPMPPRRTTLDIR